MTTLKRATLAYLAENGLTEAQSDRAFAEVKGKLPELAGCWLDDRDDYGRQDWRRITRAAEGVMDNLPVNGKGEMIAWLK